MIVTIYTLAHPITKEIRYVGRTKNPLSWRKSNHNTEARLNKSNGRKTNWIKSLHREGLRPIIEPLEVVNCSWQESHLIENYWISQFKAWGFNLVNFTDKGCGGLGLRMQAVEACQKPIYQYTIDGEFVNRFISARQANEVTGIGYRLISQCCTGYRKSTGGFLWSFKSEPPVYSITTKGTKVYQYSMEGMFIKEWHKVELAAKSLGLKNSTIAGVARGGYGRKSAGGYKWSYNKLKQLS